MIPCIRKEYFCLAKFFMYKNAFHYPISTCTGPSPVPLPVWGHGTTPPTIPSCTGTLLLPPLLDTIHLGVGKYVGDMPWLGPCQESPSWLQSTSASWDSVGLVHHWLGTPSFPRHHGTGLAG